MVKMLTDLTPTGRRMAVASSALLIGAVVAITIVPFHPEAHLTQFVANLFYSWGASDVQATLGFKWMEAIGNVLLFLPLAACLAIITQRRVAVLVACALLSLGLEWIQSLDRSRHSSLSDVALNALGIALGVGLARLMGSQRRRRNRTPHE